MTAATPIPIERPTPEPAASGPGPGDYVVPLVHVKVPPSAVDLGLWAAAGATALVGALNAPLLGAVTVGLFVVRRRHHGEPVIPAAENPAKAA